MSPAALSALVSILVTIAATGAVVQAMVRLLRYLVRLDNARTPYRSTVRWHDGCDEGGDVGTPCPCCLRYFGDEGRTYEPPDVPCYCEDWPCTCPDQSEA